MSEQTYSKHTIKLAETLTRLIDKPEFAGRRWSWDTIGATLGCTRNQAREVIYYLRSVAVEYTWTIGTAQADWEIMPTRDVREAWAGLRNQMKHIHTRQITAGRAWQVLAKVDPDRHNAELAEITAAMFDDQARSTQRHVRLLEVAIGRPT